jgi:hypothetical protein
MAPDWDAVVLHCRLVCGSKQAARAAAAAVPVAAAAALLLQRLCTLLLLLLLLPHHMAMQTLQTHGTACRASTHMHVSQQTTGLVVVFQTS